jgi:NAD dependent epimerase/dehydratase family enzyme
MIDSLVGPINPVSPNPLRNIEFMALVNRILRKPGLPLPAFFVRLLLGEMGEEFLLASRRLAPCKLVATGYQFRFPKLDIALEHELAAVN